MTKKNSEISEVLHIELRMNNAAFANDPIAEIDRLFSRYVNWLKNRGKFDINYEFMDIDGQPCGVAWIEKLKGGNK